MRKNIKSNRCHFDCLLGHPIPTNQKFSFISDRA